MRGKEVFANVLFSELAQVIVRVNHPEIPGV